MNLFRHMIRALSIALSIIYTGASASASCCVQNMESVLVQNVTDFSFEYTIHH